MKQYYSIQYEGKELMLIHASNAYEAKQKAIKTYQQRGRNNMNLARLIAK